MTRQVTVINLFDYFKKWKLNNDKNNNINQDYFATPLKNAISIGKYKHGKYEKSGFYLIPSIRACSNEKGDHDELAYQNYESMVGIESNLNHKVILYISWTNRFR